MDSIRITVYVKPWASRARVGGSHGDPPALIVAIHEQPVNGQANAAVTDTLAASLGVRRGDVRVVAGHTSRTKTVEISAADIDALNARIAELLAVRPS